MTQAEDKTGDQRGRAGRSQLVVILLVAGFSMAGAYLVFFLASAKRFGEFVRPDGLPKSYLCVVQRRYASR